VGRTRSTSPKRRSCSSTSSRTTTHPLARSSIHPILSQWTFSSRSSRFRSWYKVTHLLLPLYLDCFIQNVRNQVFTTTGLLIFVSSPFSFLSIIGSHIFRLCCFVSLSFAIGVRARGAKHSMQGRGREGGSGSVSASFLRARVRVPVYYSPCLLCYCAPPSCLHSGSAFEAHAGLLRPCTAKGTNTPDWQSACDKGSKGRVALFGALLPVGQGPKTAHSPKPSLHSQCLSRSVRLEMGCPIE
jgi:hypothetical protein